jgi:hypothetical protein
MAIHVVTILQRVQPKQGQYGVACQVLEEWFALLKTMPACKLVDVICNTEGQIAWLEDWESKAALDAFAMAHYVYSDIPPRFLDCSVNVPHRKLYQKLA